MALASARLGRTWSFLGRGNRQGSLRFSGIRMRPKSTLDQPSATPHSEAGDLAQRSNFARASRIILYPVRRYEDVQHRRPYLTQFVASLIIYFCGDLSTQYVRRPRDTGEAGAGGDAAGPGGFFATVYDPIRSARNVIIGGLFSIASYKWFLYLGTICNFPSSFALSLAAKVVVNQTFFTPVFNSYFFGMQSLLSGLLPSSKVALSQASTSLVDDPSQALKEAGRRIADTVPTSWARSWQFWPFVTAVSFTFIKPQHRSVFAGLLAIGWQTYLGILNQRAVESEEKQEVLATG